MRGSSRPSTPLSSAQNIRAARETMTPGPHRAPSAPTAGATMVSVSDGSERQL